MSKNSFKNSKFGGKDKVFEQIKLLLVFEFAT